WKVVKMSKLHEAPKCGARRKQGAGTCRQAAGWKTDHPGVGRCKLHGGGTPTKHGLYSKIKRKTLHEALKAALDDSVSLALDNEIRLLRAMVNDMLEREANPDMKRSQSWSTVLGKWWIELTGTNSL